LQQTSLKDLKAAIASSATLGQIKPNHQRLFHMGRELKTNGRSLEGLGVGKYGVYVIHLHSIAVHKNNSSPPSQQLDVDDGSSSDYDNNDTVQVLNADQGIGLAPPQSQPSNVVDLLDDTSDGSDEDDDIIVFEQVVVPSKRARLC
jgi:hypothetical protein